MKKIFLLIALVVIAIAAEAQTTTTFTVYNNSSYDFNIDELTTCKRYDSDESIYPIFTSTNPNVIKVLSGQTYVLQEPAGFTSFPIYSPTSAPAITRWDRSYSAGVFTNVSSVMANNSAIIYDPMKGTYGSQKFYQLKSFMTFTGTENKLDSGQQITKDGPFSYSGAGYGVMYYFTEFSNNTISYVVYVYNI
jgi:hypothetical protein